MDNKSKRVSITIPEEIAVEIEGLKKSDYYSESYATIYRVLLIEGLKVLKAKSKGAIKNDET